MSLNGNMLHSDYVSAAKGAIRKVQEVVRYRGLNTAGGWIRHPLEGSLKVGARVYQAYLGRERSAKFGGEFDGAVYINEMARLAADTWTGNCSELSAVAFKHLEMMGVVPIDYFGVWRGSWNHAFVVLARDSSIPIRNFSDWSYQAVVCDPLYDRAADAGFLSTWYPRMFPLKDQDMVYRIE